MNDGTSVKLSFEGLIPKNGISTYYAANYDGYLGFNFEDLYLVSKAWVQYYGLTDTGFGSVLHGNAEAATQAAADGLGFYGNILSSYAGETFNLKSGIFASYRGPQETSFTSETANRHVKAVINVSLSETATTINFASYGRDFKNIGLVDIYAPSTTTVMDNLKVHWNGPIPGSGAMKHHVHVGLSVLTAMTGRAAPNHSNFADPGADNYHDTAHNHELKWLASSWHDGDGLTAQFSLPQIEHFGT